MLTAQQQRLNIRESSFVDVQVERGWIVERCMTGGMRVGSVGLHWKYGETPDDTPGYLV